MGNPSLLIDSCGFTSVWVLETCISVRLALHSTGIIFLFIPTGKKGREITESREFHTALTEYVCVCVTGVISHRCTVFSGFMIRVFVCVCPSGLHYSWMGAWAHCPLIITNIQTADSNKYITHLQKHTLNYLTAYLKMSHIFWVFFVRDTN